MVYVGTYTGAQSKGIYLFRLPLAGRGAAPDVSPAAPILVAESANPTFLAVDPTRRFLYAANEIASFEGQPTGAVSAFAIDPASGKLTLLNQRATAGGIPCHVLLDPSGRNLLVANYGGGSVIVFPVQADGQLGERTAFIQHAGKSVHPTRQTGPHAHGFTLDPASRFAFACDLGLDQVLAYRFDAEQGTLTPGNPPFAAVKPGAGPRHMVFRPDGRFAYVFNEMDSTIAIFRYDAARGYLDPLKTITTLPAGFAGQSSGAEIAMLPSGKYLYVSNRGYDTVVQFEIDAAEGTLRHVADLPSGGKTPRNFAIDPTGTLMAIGNQKSNNVLICDIDAASGRLNPSGVVVEVPSPACVVFVSAP